MGASKALRGFFVAGCLVVTVPGAVHAFVFTDDFTTGVDTTFWAVEITDTFYVLDDSQGDVRIRRGYGGDYSFTWAKLRFRPRVHGDFDASVDFRNARIGIVTGAPGNQIQLNTSFGGQLFAVVRSNEVAGGNNHHVFVNPPGQWWGAQPDVSTSGTLRIVRTGTLVSGYIGSTLIFSAVYNDSVLDELSFSLQNNGTIDSTAVTFDHFVLVADSVVSGVGSGTAVPAPASLAASPNPFGNRVRLASYIGQSGHVRLEVFDVAGRRVRVLFDGRAAGDLVRSWDGRDERGHRVPSGVYFARLSHPGGAAVRKLVLLR